MEFKQLWSDLNPETRGQFESQSQTIELKRGENIYLQGDIPKGIYFVKSGLVGLMKTGASGKEHLLRFFRQGQFFGHRTLFSNEGYHGSTVALEPTQIKLVPKPIVLEALNKQPQLLLDVVKVLAKELRRCEDQHVLILDNEILVRVAQALIYLKDLHPQHNWTRQEIANFCASTVSTVIKALAELEDKGLISQSGRAINILKRDVLVAMQDEGQ
jgi:CRP-like cAMP-binding protein